MSQLALTHGTLYHHFPARKALLAKLFVQCCKDAAALLKAGVESVLPGREPHAILDCYLSPPYRDIPSLGYALPTFGAELASQSCIVRNTFTKALQKFFTQTTSYMSEDGHKSRRD